jgi:hypothetical protein
VTDEKPKKRTRRPRSAPAADAPPTGDVAGDAADPDEALKRLESMGSAKPAADAVGVSPIPSGPAVDSFGPPPTARPQRPMGSSQRAPRSRPRPAAGGSPTRFAARIAAPVVFLVAVIALIGIVVNSGVMSSDEPTPTPTVKSTKAGGSSVTKKYVVKTGDSLSSIAVRFNTTTSELQVLNPDIGNTLVVGTRIVVPRQ